MLFGACIVNSRMCVMREMLQVHYCISARGTFGGALLLWLPKCLDWLYIYGYQAESCSAQSCEELCIHTYSGDVVESLYKHNRQNVDTSSQVYT